jgi:dTDP-glucose pyrophosphorylase
MYKNRVIDVKSSLLDALKKMDELAKKLLIVIDNNSYIGLLSVGDIQRAIISNKPLETQVSKVLRNDNRIAKPSDSIIFIKEMMLEFRMELCPVVNEKHQIEKVYFWEDLFLNEKPEPKKQFNLPIVIMAGGVGSRLKPLTNVLPKPLIPIGEKTILEHIFDRFSEYGNISFLVSLNYKAELIEYYVNNLKLPFDFHFFKEDMPMGTAGSLSLIKDRLKETFFITNCDILIEQDYSEILDYHRNNNNELTIVAALKHFHIPYGIIETGENGSLETMIEKPDLTYKINSGMYILEPELLNEIPEGKFFHITDLIETIKKRNGKLGVFPVSEKSWIDIGEWDKYIKANIEF